MSLERYPEAVELYERMLAYSRRVQATLFEGVAFVQLANLDWWAGRWRQAWAWRQEILHWMAASPGSSMAKVWASNLLGLMYNDLGQPEEARAVLSEYTMVARSAHEPQTTLPHLGQLARCAQSESQKAELVQEICKLIDVTAYPRYEILPVLRLACSWLAQTSGGEPAALSRLEKVYNQMQNWQSAASLDEARAYAAGLRDEWAQAISYYEAAAAHWETLERPYDLLRTLVGLAKARSFAQLTDVQPDDRTILRNVRTRSGFIIEQLASELDEPEVKQAFLDSPLVMEIRRGQSA